MFTGPQDKDKDIFEGHEVTTHARILPIPWQVLLVLLAWGPYFKNLWFSDLGADQRLQSYGLGGWLVTKIGQEHAGLMENYHFVWFKIFLKNFSVYFLAVLGLSCHMQDLHCVLRDL